MRTGGNKRLSFLRRRRLSYKRGVRIIRHAIGSNPKTTAIILVSICALFFAASLTTDGYHLLHSSDGSHGGRALSNSTREPDAAIVEGVHSCENYVRLNQVGVGFAILWIIVLLYFFIGLAIICDDFFVSSLERISESLSLSEDVAGATFMAAGSSAPELFTSVMDTFYFTNNVGIGTIVGSAVFNILVIIALAAAMSKEDLLIDWRPFLRDCCFYSMSVVLLFVFVLYGSFTWLHSLVLVLFYGLYVLFMVFNEKLLAKCGDGIQVEKVENFEDDKKMLDADGIELSQVGSKTENDKRKQLIPHMMTVTEDEDGEHEEAENKTAFDKFIDIICIPWSFIFSWTIPDAGEQSEYKKYFVITFLMCLVWITALSYILCDMVARLGCMWHVPAPIMGLTVLAAGTSVPDALGSIVAAREGMGDMACSNAIGSNVFDICLGLGLPYLLKTVFTKGGAVIAVPADNKEKMLPSIIILAITLLGTGGIMIANKWRLTQNVGRSLFLLYLCFFIYNVILGIIG